MSQFIGVPRLDFTNPLAIGVTPLNSAFFVLFGPSATYDNPTAMISNDQPAALYRFISSPTGRYTGASFPAIVGTFDDLDQAYGELKMLPDGSKALRSLRSDDFNIAREGGVPILSAKWGSVYTELLDDFLGLITRPDFVETASRSFRTLRSHMFRAESLVGILISPSQSPSKSLSEKQTIPVYYLNLFLDYFAEFRRLVTSPKTDPVLLVQLALRMHYTGLALTELQAC